MEQPTKKRIVLRPSAPAVKILLVVAVVLSLAAMLTVHWVRGNIREQTEQKRQEAAALEQENADLEEKMQNLDALDTLEDIANSELGLVHPDSIILGE